MTWGFHIYDFMIEGMGLRGNELLAYALIYSCTCKGNGSWHGGYNSLADMIGVSRLTAINIMKRLVDDDLITKESIQFKDKQINIFKANLHQVDKLLECSIDFIPEGVKNLYPASKESIPNNIIDNINNIDNNIIPKREKNFKKPTLEEIQDYCLERNNSVDAVRFYDFYESKGWKIGKNLMKDWKAAVRTWERNRPQQTAHPTRMDSYQATLKDILEGRL